MTDDALRALLDAVRGGRMTPDDAVARLRALPFEDLGFAKVDHHRAIRCGFPEVIYGGGKSVDDFAAIFERCAGGGGSVLATRVSDDMFQTVRAKHPGAVHHAAARAITLRQGAPSAPVGTVVVVTAGTSDIPVAEEARVTARIMDLGVRACYDVGVAGIHRLLAHAEALQSADVVIAVAGMEGALPSVIGGLVSCPVIAVPTSVGYGAGWGGVAALLSMLTSCAAGVTVVNIDNGFGAGYAAARIVRGKKRGRESF